MPEIQEQNLFAPTIFNCTHCECSINSQHLWLVDGGRVCDECFDNTYSHLVKCGVADCNTYMEEDDLTDGMCESCLEVDTPLDPSDQEGGEHNIRRWNEG
jgi:hypothetical protein